MSDILDKLRAFYENAETDECLYDIRRAIEELERLYALPVFDGPPTWQEEVASVEEAFERSGVKPTWPDDEAGNIGPMAAAMADEIELLQEGRKLDGESIGVLVGECQAMLGRAIDCQEWSEESAALLWKIQVQSNIISRLKAALEKR
jgi:hypothetical protein